MSYALTRRRFLLASGAAVGAAALPLSVPIAGAEPHGDEEWIANHTGTRLLADDGSPVAWVPQWSRMRILQGLRGGWLEVWVPRLGLVGKVPISAIGPVAAPSEKDLASEVAEGGGPPDLGAVGLPARVSGGGNLRLWPVARADTQLRALPHNAPIRVISSVEGDDGEEWYHVNWLDSATNEPIGDGFLHNSVVRLPRLRLTTNPDRSDDKGKWFEADLKEPALLTAYEGSAPVWNTLTLKGTTANRTPIGEHGILWRVPNETMTSERVYPPIPRNAPGGYYLTGVLYTQYFTSDGASIHYNYWSSNWGYAGSHGCLGIALHEAKWAWDWAEVGTPVTVFG